jgi:hypothetical protein
VVCAQKGGRKNAASRRLRPRHADDRRHSSGRRAAIKKGQFIAGGPIVKRASPLPADLEIFADPVASAGPTHGPQFQRIQREQEEISQRLTEAKQRVEEFRTTVRRRR